MIDELLKSLAPQVLGVLARRCGDFDAAEDAVQEALLAAYLNWTDIPDNPRGWLLQAAHRKLIDQMRWEEARRKREEKAARDEISVQNGQSSDDSSAVLAMCCHPSLSPASQIALTLRAAGGLTTAEIAGAFLVPEATMAQRISRAKQKIKASGVPFRQPEDQRSVRHVLYLIFNEGYGVQRADLAAEAIRLCRLLHTTDDPETAGLLALMLLTDARRPARQSPDGELIPLEEQDRGLWNHRQIAEGTVILDAAFTRGAVGEYQLQAAIAALHCRAAKPADTDWPQILALYGLLERMTGNPVVTLNRAVALAMVDGPRAALEMIKDLDGLGHRVDAVRAHLLERAGEAAQAARLYAAAAGRATSLPERRHLTTRAARLR
ncbi:RNA polymerase sigma factor [Actinoplanes sp. CA-142083]|uniref:RNA polymerase sigma factor n=1 Tax=Actinoplanes sp. CA-142083 TaxID=3239903 RepID=UPI003D8D37E2